MILTCGDTSSLGTEHWYMVELRSEKTAESTLKRLGTQLPAIFRESPVEVFIPVFERDLNLFELRTGNYVFARSKNFQALLRLKSVTGVVGLVTLGDSGQPSKAIPVDHAYVQSLIDECEQFFFDRALTLLPGSFVRILDGEQRDFCGTILELRDGVACVQIEVKTKVLLVETPVRNLLNLSHLPDFLRVFYYAPMVESLDVPEQIMLLAEDLKYEEPPACIEDGLDVEKIKRHGRQQTVTALVKNLILTGTTSPSKIAAEVILALKEERLKCPKNLSIVHGIIKHRLIVDHFKKIDASIENYREVVAKFGQEWKFSLNCVVEAAGAFGLPVHSGTTEEHVAPPTPPIKISAASHRSEA